MFRIASKSVEMEVAGIEPASEQASA